MALVTLGVARVGRCGGWVCALLVGLLLSWPAAASVSFLPARSMPVLLLLDAESMPTRQAAAWAGLGYALEPDLFPDCSATEQGLLMLRLQLAPRTVAVVSADDRVLVLQALHDLGATLELDVPFDSDAAAAHPLLGPLHRLMYAGHATAGLHALVARRGDAG